MVLPTREHRLGFPAAGTALIPSPEALFVLVVVDGFGNSVRLTVGASVRFAVLLTPDELRKRRDEVASGFEDQVRIDGSGIAVQIGAGPFVSVQVAVRYWPPWPLA